MARVTSSDTTVNILIKAPSKNNCNPSLERKKLRRALRGALFREPPSN